MDAESAFLYLAGEMKSRAADVTAVHLVECAQCRDLVEEVSGIIGSSRELLQLAHHGGLDTEPPSPDVLMARGTALLRARRPEAGRDRWTSLVGPVRPICSRAPSRSEGGSGFRTAIP
jgi:anti-sigma factor ChrR (cupin superfamily)